VGSAADCAEEEAAEKSESRLWYVRAVVWILGLAEMDAVSASSFSFLSLSSLACFFAAWSAALSPIDLDGLDTILDEFLLILGACGEKRVRASEASTYV
jgi:hypothetical protein